MRIGESIWHCHRSSLPGADIITYDAPKKYTLAFGYITVQPTKVALNNMSGFYTTEDFGEHTANGWNIFANFEQFVDVFTEGDLLYLDGNSPATGEENGKGANAIITSIREQNRMIMYTVNRLEGT